MNVESTSDSGATTSTEAPLDPALNTYLNYPFERDSSYQQGLASLIAEGRIDLSAPQDQRDEALRRTRVFYFNRVSGLQLTVEAVRNHEVSRQTHGSSSSDAPVSSADTNANRSSDETRVLTFAELQELIETGKVDQIPNNKVIPDAINENTPSVSTASARRKPWEQADPVT